MYRKLSISLASAVAAAALFASPASATLMISVTGSSGAGVTTWELSGTSSASDSGTVRTPAGSASFSPDDSMEIGSPNSGSFIIPAINNTLFAVTGAASVTIGADTETITHIFLDDDGVAFDDLGIRTSSSIGYLSTEMSSWMGSFTVNLDIDTFTPGTYALAGVVNGFFNGPDFAQAGDVSLTISKKVPEPGTLALFGLGLAGLGIARRRKAA